MTATLERGLNALREQIDAPVASFFTSCVSCGLCAEACLFYKETGDPQYTPIHKLEPMKRIWQNEFTLLGRAKSLLGLGKKVDDEMLTEWETLVYDSCTLCGRCTLVCPVGNDITMMVRKLREGMSSSGHGPVELTGAAVRHTEGTSPMGNLSKALQARVKQAEALTDLEIELDKPDVDYLLLLSSHEIAAGPEMIESIAKIMAKAGKSWTISTEGFEATNVGIQLGNRDIAANLVMRIVNAAEKLRVKTVISPECGHAFQAVRWEGPNLIGRPYKFEVKHIIEVLDDFRAKGLLKTNGEKDHAKITFHDPCQVARRGGVIKEPRNLLNMVADNFVETENAGVMNWCCSGGGGVGANQRANEIQEKAFGRKKKQIQDVAPDKIVTMCSFCHTTLEDQLEIAEMDDIEVASLTEMMAEYLEE